MIGDGLFIIAKTTLVIVRTKATSYPVKLRVNSNEIRTSVLTERLENKTKDGRKLVKL